MIQEYVAGKDLEEKIKSGFRVTEKEIRQIAKNLLDILVYLQQFKPPVIHRDINPRNIILNDNNQIFLVDFGAVQAATQGDSIGTKTIVGTAGYMPMEQIMGRSCEATDLYSTGVTLIYLLTHEDPINLPVKNMKIDYTSIVTVSKPFKDFLDNMIEPDVLKRFQNASKALSFLKAPVIVKEEKKDEKVDKKVDLEWEIFKNDFVQHVKKEYSEFYDENYE